MFLFSKFLNIFVKNINYLIDRVYQMYKYKHIMLVSGGDLAGKLGNVKANL